MFYVEESNSPRFPTHQPTYEQCTPDHRWKANVKPLVRMCRTIQLLFAIFIVVLHVPTAQQVPTQYFDQYAELCYMVFVDAWCLIRELVEAGYVDGYAWEQLLNRVIEREKYILCDLMFQHYLIIKGCWPGHVWAGGQSEA